jgi:cell division protein FtsW
VKLAMVIFLAKYMSMPGYSTESFVSFIKPLGVMALFQVVFLKQPDFGSTMSLAFLTITLLFISGMRLSYIASILLLALPVVYKLVMEPYRLRRITSFIDPWKDPLGSGFQLVQSFISLGSGGLTGLGLGESKQKLSFLPASHTDFIFCLVGEELGLIGATVLITLFIFLFVRGISIANRAGDSFVHYLAYGLTLMISLQALINFAVVTGMVPTKGLPLPFVSYGGSALLMNMAAVGILLRISKGEEDPADDENKNVKARMIARRNIYARKGSGR